ncbi:MAG: asparagine synthase C-terminal domain-containing protein, partial [Candidatus Bathyarchaeia archaeon]
MNVNSICSELRRLLEESVKRHLAEGILLSGGLDTSIIAAIASKYVKLKAFTVAFKEAESPDIEYAKRVAEEFKLEHIIRSFSMDEFYNELPTIIRIVKSFDPMEIRNSIVILVGLRTAKNMGVNTILTGDGADELFAGYSFLFNYSKKELERELEKLWRNMHFSSIDIAEYLNVEAKLPYLDYDFQSFAKQIDPELKVRRENSKVIGKWILRKAFESILPQNITWRIKTPIEQGSGTTRLPQIFNKLIS